MNLWEEDLLVGDLMELLDSCLPALYPGQSYCSLPAFHAQIAPLQPTITTKQLRALSKKHLLMMIHDLERELQQEKEFKEYLLQAHQAIFSRWPVSAKIVETGISEDAFALPVLAKTEKRKRKKKGKKRMRNKMP